MDIRKLSEVASVTVTKQGDVKFMVIPKEEVLLETEVVFTTGNWISFVTIARPKLYKLYMKKMLIFYTREIVKCQWLFIEILDHIKFI